MTTVENTIDHSYLQHLACTNDIAFRAWRKVDAPRFYLNTMSSDQAEHIIMRLFQLTDTHFKGERITPEQHSQIVQKALVPTKLWVSQGQVYTDEFVSPLSEADKQAVITVFLDWAAPVDLSIHFQNSPLDGLAVVAERAIILDTFRAEHGLEGLPDSYIIKMWTSLPPQSEK